MKIHNPKSIKKELDRFVSGQDEAKKVLSNALFIHHLRYLLHSKGDDTKFKAPVVLLTGGTGTGKTFTVETLANIGKLPYHKICAKSITQTGYVGKSFDQHLKEYFKANVRKGGVEFGILHIDEIDKLSCLGGSDQLNAWKIGVQHMLLRAIEGQEYVIECGGGIEIKLDTSKFLIVFSGSFEEYSKMNKTKLGIGFNSTESSLYPELVKNSTNALIEAGLIPEFVGRISSIIKLDNLTKKDLRDILLKKESSVYKLYQTLLSLCDIDISLNSRLISKVIDQAYDLNTGARGLKTALEQQLENIIYKISKINHVKVDEYLDKIYDEQEIENKIIEFKMKDIKETK